MAEGTIVRSRRADTMHALDEKNDTSANEQIPGYLEYEPRINLHSAKGQGDAKEQLLAKRGR